LAVAAEQTGAVTVEVEAFWSKVEEATYRRLKGIEDEEERHLRPKKKGPARRPPKTLRRKGNVLRRL
ncbi:MAG: hypothetical protein QF619_06640, partial [Candidatus Binatia bacterium]|nr:hypothetical protein [Candidatus Binatia bacterium]